MNELVSRFPQSSGELRLFLGMHINRLTQHAWFMLGNREDAEDVVQEAIIRGYRMREQLKTVGNPVAYMFRMVSNGCLDLLRQKNSRENVVVMKQHFSQLNFSESREDELIREEEHQRVRLLLNLLPQEQVEVIRFRFADDLAFPAIAKIVEAPVTTVKSRFSYGMMKLRSMMNEQKEVSHEM